MPEVSLQRVMEVFDQVSALPPAERASALETLCSSDLALRREVESMLTADASAGGALDRAGAGVGVLAGAIASSASAENIPPPVLAGRYQILRAVGEGGMGVVYEALQTHPRRRVALKAMRPGLASRSMLKRFAHEAQVLARLQHPGIAQVYEAGAADPAAPDQAFFVMEFVDGSPIVAYARQHALDVNDTLSLMARVCDAVHHAHQRAVIHRDLKPANILVDAAGAPRVLDFGVARLAGDEPFATTMHTAAGQIVGTLGYMSPEQLDATADVDAASDVYALGVILYEILAGKHPFDLAGKPLAEAARIVREQPPVLLGQVNRALRAEVEVIVATAMHVDRARRYQSAAALADDLRRAVAGLPIDARRDSAIYVLRKLAKRHWTLVSLAAVLFIAIVAFGVVSAALAHRNLTLADRNAALAEEKSKALIRSQRTATDLERALYVSRIGHAQAAIETGDAGRAQRQLEACPPELRRWEWDYFNSRAQQSIRSYPVDGDDVWSDLAPDGRTLVCSSPDGETYLIDTEATGPGRRFPGGYGRVQCTLSPDGRTLAGVRLTGIELCDAVTGEVLRTLTPLDADGKPNMARCVRFTRDGRELVSVCSASRIHVWDAATGALRRQFQVHDQILQTGAISGDATLAVTCAGDGIAKVTDLATGATVAQTTLESPNAQAIDLSPRSRLVCAGFDGGRLMMWDWGAGTPPRYWDGHIRTVYTVRFSPDDSTVASGGRDLALRAWDTNTLARLWDQRGEPFFFRRISWTPDGTGLFTTGAFSRARVWSARPAADVAVIDTQRKWIRSITVSHDGGSLLLGCEGGIALVMLNNRSVGVLRELKPDVFRAYTTAAGVLGAACADGRLLFWDTPDNAAPTEIVVQPGGCNRCGLSRDGNLLAIAGKDGSLVIVDVVARKVISRTQAGTHSLNNAELTPDGRTAITVGEEYAVNFFTVPDGRLVRSLDLGASGFGLRVSEDGTKVAASGDRGHIRVWRIADGSLVCEPKGHLGPIFDVCFLEHDTRLVTVGQDGAVRLWVVDTGQELATLPGHRASATAIGILPDGRTLVTSDSAGFIRLWSAPAPAPSPSPSSGNTDQTPPG